MEVCYESEERKSEYRRSRRVLQRLSVFKRSSEYIKEQTQSQLLRLLLWKDFSRGPPRSRY